MNYTTIRCRNLICDFIAAPTRNWHVFPKYIAARVMFMIWKAAMEGGVLDMQVFFQHYGYCQNDANV
jgi:hypothetical protein